METRRWTNPGQPQTLQIAVFLLYINAAFGLLFGSLGLLFVVAFAAGGFGIANEKRWGYWLAVVGAGLRVALFLPIIVSDGIGSILNLNVMLAMLFPVALFALLVHPMSRSYQRIWFT